MNINFRKWLLLAGDIALCYLALGAGLFARHGGINESFYLTNVVLFTPVFFFWIASLYAVGLYEFRPMVLVYSLLVELLMAMWVNLFAGVVLFYVLEPYFGRGMTPKTNLLFALLFAHLGFFLWRRFWARIISEKAWAERIAFLGNSPIIKAMEADIKENPFLGCQIVDLSAFDHLLEFEEIGFNPYRIRRRLKGRFPADRVVIEDQLVRSGLLLFRKVFELSMACGVPIVTHFDFYEDLYHQISPYYAGRPDWLLHNILSRDKQVYRVVKRFVDLLGATLGLILLSPLLLFVALISWLSGIRRPLYFQKRLGYLGSEFQICKFRTMVEGADQKGPLWEIPNADARVTGWGGILRRIRIDEFPQLWNVLKGEMSLVGPRPEWIEEIEILEQAVPHYHLRHLVKPGITGWAQVNFRATNSPEDSLEKLRYDLFYVKNMSLALDLSILLKTFKRVFRPEESFGRARKATGIVPAPN